MTALPRVGARIRVTRTYAERTVVAVEGIVAAFDLDRFEHVTCIRLADGVPVSLKNDMKSTVTWVELESPKPPLLAEPADGTIWLRPGDEGRIDQVFLRADRAGTGWNGADRWFGTASGQRSWEKLDIREGDELIRLVPAPDLAALVAELRETAPRWHDYECGEACGQPVFSDCTTTDCVDRRALLARYETGAAA